MLYTTLRLVFYFLITFLLGFTSARANDINSCETAIDISHTGRHVITHGNSIAYTYFKITGDDQIHHLTFELDDSYITFEVLKGSCDKLKLIDEIERSSTRNEFLLNVPLGDTYYIKVKTLPGINHSTVIDYETIQARSNDLCQNADPIEINTIISSDMYQTSSVFGSECYINVYGTSQWFSFVSDGRPLYLDFIESNIEDYYFTLTPSYCINECSQSVYIKDVLAYEATLETEKDKRYYLQIIQAHGNETGVFKFQLKSEPAPINSLCQGSIELEDNMIYKDSVKFSDTDNIPCSPFDVEGLWYKVIGQDKLVELDFEYFPRNTTFKLFEGSCDAISCSTVEIDTRNQSIYFDGEEDKEYYILIIPGFWRDVVEFTYKTHNYQENSFCNAALNITCGEERDLELITARRDLNTGTFTRTLWYRILGNNKIPQITLSNYSSYYEIYNACHPDSIIGNEDHLILLESGQEYLIAIRSRSPEENRGKIAFNISCVDSAPNNICDNAILLEEQVGDIQFNTANYYYTSNPCSDQQFTEAWYRIVGNDNIYEFVNYFNSPTAIFRLYKGTCDNIECTNIAGTSLLFFAEKDSVYFMTIRFSSSYNKTPLIYYSHFIPPPNDGIDKALDVTCGEKLELNFNNATSLGNPFCNGIIPERTLWYSVTGNDKAWKFDYNLSQAMKLYIFQEINGTLNCIETARLDDTRDYNYILEEGIQYLIGFGVEKRFGLNHISLTCSDLSEGQSLSNASLLDCNQTIEFPANPYEVIDPNERACSSVPYPYFFWYKIDGNNTFKTITKTTGDDTQISLFQIVDNELICLTSSSTELAFYTYLGTTYFISVSGRNYRFETSCDSSSPLANDICSNSIPIECGLYFTAIFDQATRDYEQNICTQPSSKLGIWYHFIGNGDLLNIEADEQFSDITIYEGSCEELVCLFDNITSPRKLVKTEVGKAYKILIRTRRNPDEKMITVSCEEPLINDYCSEAIDIKVGDTLDLDLSNATNLDDVNECTKEVTYAAWYRTTGNGQSLILNVSGDLALFYKIHVFEGSCEECEKEIYNAQETLTTFDDTSFDDTRFTFNTENEKTYYIALRYSGRIPKKEPLVTIDLETRTVDPNASLENAVSLNCSDTLQINPFQGVSIDPNCDYFFGNRLGFWYKFEGNNQTIEFRKDTADALSLLHATTVHVFEEIDGVLTCTGEDPQGRLSTDKQRLFTEQGKLYYFFISDRYNWAERKIFFSCIEPATNDLCVNAQELIVNPSGTRLGNPNIAHIEAATFHDENITYYCWPFRQREDVWFKTKGTGEILNLDFSNGMANNFRIDIYEGACPLIDCLANSEIEVAQEGNYNFTFHTELGKEYLIRIANALNVFTPSFTFYASYRDYAPNSQCDGATLVVCGSTQIDSLDFSPINTRLESSMWYKFIGDGDHHQFTFGGNYRDYKKEFFRGENCTSVNRFSLFSRDSTALIKTTLRETYYLKITQDTREGYTPFSISLECVKDRCGPFEMLTIEGPSVICKDTRDTLEFTTNALSDHQYRWYLPSHNNYSIISGISDTFKIVKKPFTNNSSTLISLNYTDACGRRNFTNTSLHVASNYACSLMNCTKENLTINNPLLQEFDPQNTYKVQSSIQSNAHVDQSTMYFHAGQEIILDPNFEIGDGKIFEAVIEECVEDW